MSELAEKIKSALPYATVTEMGGELLIEVPAEKMQEAFLLVKELSRE